MPFHRLACDQGRELQCARHGVVHSDRRGASELNGLMAQNGQINLARARSMGNGPVGNVMGTRNVSTGAASVRLTGEGCDTASAKSLAIVPGQSCTGEFQGKKADGVPAGV